MYFFKRSKIHCLMLRYESSKLDFILLNKPKSEDNLPVKLNGQYIWFFLKNTQFEVIIWSFCYWKKELYLVKSQQWVSMNRNGSAAVPNFGRGFTSYELHIPTTAKNGKSYFLVCMRTYSILLHHMLLRIVDRKTTTTNISITS